MYFPVAENVKALKEVWFLGDSTLKEWFIAFQSVKAQAMKDEQTPPYLFHYYDLDQLSDSSTSDNPSMLAWVNNVLVSRLNERLKPHLLRYIVILLDIDLIKDIKIFDYGVADTFETTIKWLVNCVDRNIDAKKENLRNIRPEAIAPASEPRLIWVKALPRPEIMLAKSIFSLICKFNNILENIIADDRHSHILKVDVQPNNTNFDRLRHLTPFGKIEFWRDLDNKLKEFDRGKTKLIPQKYRHFLPPGDNKKAGPSPLNSRFKWHSNTFYRK